MKRFFLGVVAACGVVTATIVFAAQDQDNHGDSATKSNATRYAVAPAGDSAVLLDSATGRTWLLTRSADLDKAAVWLPITRFDDDEAAAKWLDHEGRHRSAQNARLGAARSIQARKAVQKAVQIAFFAELRREFARVRFELTRAQIQLVVDSSNAKLREQISFLKIEEKHLEDAIDKARDELNKDQD